MADKLDKDDGVVMDKGAGASRMTSMKDEKPSISAELDSHRELMSLSPCLQTGRERRRRK